MTVHLLDLSGDRQSGRTILALDMLELRMLQGLNVVYATATEQQAQWLKKKTMTDVPCMSFAQLMRHNAVPQFVVLDNYSQSKDTRELTAYITHRMRIYPLAWIVRID